MNYFDVGKKIRTKRLELGMTQEKLAEEIGISTAYLGCIERGERGLYVETMVKIANSLGCTPDYFLSDSIQKVEPFFAHEWARLTKSLNKEEKQLVLNTAEILVNGLKTLKKS